MTSLAQLLTDVDNSVGRRSENDRVLTLRRLTDLLVGNAEGFGESQLGLFDEVIQRFAFDIEIGARVELAERLSGLARAPRGILETLAHDQIIVARPVLSGSRCLSDESLLDVASRRGRDHMLAMCGRREVSSIVTDVLVATGDGTIRQAIAGNVGATFTAHATAALLDHAQHDGALAEALGGRMDLPPSARRRLAEAGQRSPVGGGGKGTRSYAAATTTLQSLASRRSLSETDLIYFATHDRMEEAIVSIAMMSGLPPRCIGEIFEDADNDLLLVIGRVQGWSWRTVHALLRLRGPTRTDRNGLRRAEEVFDGLNLASAARVVQLLKLRQAGSPLASQPAKRAPERFEAGQTRTKVM